MISEEKLGELEETLSEVLFEEKGNSKYRKLDVLQERIKKFMEEKKYLAQIEWGHYKELVNNLHAKFKEKYPRNTSFSE